MSEQIKQYLNPGKKNLILIYILYLSGIIIPILTIIGAVFAFANKESDNSLYKSHYSFAFRTFYLMALGYIIAMVTTFIFVLPIIYMLIFIWFVVRSIFALQYLLDDQPHPNPQTFWIR